MKNLVICLAILALSAFAAGPAAAQVRVVEAALCADVVDRQPMGVITSGEQTSPPVVQAGEAAQIFLWTKIATDEEATIVHSWYKENPDVAQSGMELAPAAEIELRVKPSDGFRTWSRVSLLPGLSEGSWRVTVTTAADPRTILYQEAFEVK